MQPSQSVFLGFIYLCVLSVIPPLHHHAVPNEARRGHWILELQMVVSYLESSRIVRGSSGRAAWTRDCRDCVG